MVTQDIHVEDYLSDERELPTRKEVRMGMKDKLGICQWFHYQYYDEVRQAVDWLHEAGVRHLRTGISWADFTESTGPLGLTGSWIRCGTSTFFFRCGMCRLPYPKASPVRALLDGSATTPISSTWSSGVMVGTFSTWSYGMNPTIVGIGIFPATPRSGGNLPRWWSPLRTGQRPAGFASRQGRDRRLSCG
jgi:hypothetical protein